MLSQVAIYGQGIAASCCAKLLERRSVSFSFQPVPSRNAPRPTLLINGQTLKLIADVFGDQEALFSGASIIRRRVVLWGNATEPQSFPHAGLAMPEGVLLERLWNKIKLHNPVSGSADWAIYSARPGLDRVVNEFGSRSATAVAVELIDSSNDACWIESVAEGWLFLVPTGHGCGSVIAVGASSQTLLSQSRLIAPEISNLIDAGVEFSAHPRIFVPLCAPGWLACGTAAMAFDPICGEGAGNAVREAILASAVLGNIHNDVDQTATLHQYASRLLAGFFRHLEICKQFYVSGRQGGWWDNQITDLDRSLNWTRAQLSVMPSPSSRLVGFDLEPRQPA